MRLHTPRLNAATRVIVLGGLLVALPLMVFLPAAAQQSFTLQNPLGKDPTTGQEATFETIVVRIANWAAAIAVPLTTLMVLYAAYLYLFGGGNEEQIKKAHKALTWAAVGFIVVLISSGFSALIQNILSGK